MSLKEPPVLGFEGSAEGANYTGKEEMLSFGRITAVKATTFINGEPYLILIGNFQGIKNPKWGVKASILYTWVPNLEESAKINDQIVSTLRFLP